MCKPEVLKLLDHSKSRWDKEASNPSILQVPNFHWEKMLHDKAGLEYKSPAVFPL